MPYKRNFTLAVISFALLGCASVCWSEEESAPAAAATPAKAGSGPKLRCEKPVYQFEPVWSGESVSHDYIVHNDGDEPLEILGVKTTCGCTVAQYDKVIAPGKSGKVTLTLSTRSAQEAKNSKKAFVTTNDPKNKQLALTIEGMVRPRISVDPAQGANFERVMEEVEQTRIVTVTNHTDKPIKLEPQASPTGKTEVFSAEVREVEPGKVFEVTVKATPPFREGYNYAALKYGTGLAEQPDVSIYCRMTSPPLLEISPAALMVTVPLTSDFRKSVLIRYNGQEPMKVESATCANGQVKLDLKETEPGKAWQLDISLPASFDSEATVVGDVVVKTDLKTRPERHIPIRARPMSTPQRPQPVEPTAAPGQLLGKPAPAVQLRSPQGQPIEIGPGSGSVTVLNFWASWSALSRSQLPILQELHNRYARQGVSFINVSMDRLTPPGPLMLMPRELNVTVPIALDTQQEAAAQYGVEGPPTLFLIGKGGSIEAVHKGLPTNEAGLKAYRDRLVAELDVLLEGKAREAFPPGAAISGPITAADAIVQNRPPAPTPDSARLVLESLEQYTGRHRPGQEVDYLVYCRNEGSRPLTITSASGSDGLAVDPSFTRVLRPGLSTALRCTFKAPARPESFSHRLKLTTDDLARSEVEVTLLGETQPFLQVNPAAGIDFGDNPRTHGMSRMATITYSGSDPIEYKSATSSSPEFQVTVEKILDGPNAKVIVDTRQPLAVGEHKALIAVETTCKEQPTIEIPVVLRRPERIEITPAEIILDSASRLQKASVLIANNGTEPLHILGVERSSPRIRTQFYPEPDGFSYKLELTVPGNLECGPEGEKVTIRTDDQEHAEIVVPIRRAPAAQKQTAATR